MGVIKSDADSTCGLLMRGVGARHFIFKCRSDTINL